MAFALDHLWTTVLYSNSTFWNYKAGLEKLPREVKKLSSLSWSALKYEVKSLKDELKNFWSGVEKT